MFPRVALRDARRWTVTLSHFCPTAASLLFEDDEDVQIVDAPASLIDVGPLDGLDAADVIPPLLRDGVLMDLDSFSEWESQAIRVLTARRCTPDASLSQLERLTDELARWSPGDGDLIERVRAVFQFGGERVPRDGERPIRGAGLHGNPANGERGLRDGDRPILTAGLHGSPANGQRPLSDGERPIRSAGLQACPADDGAESRAVQRWLAAHLFGNWIAYQGRGLRTIVRYLRACLDVFRIELARDGDALQAIRRSDYLIVHESDSQQLATSIDALTRRGREA